MNYLGKNGSSRDKNRMRFSPEILKIKLNAFMSMNFPRNFISVYGDRKFWDLNNYAALTHLRCIMYKRNI